MNKKLINAFKFLFFLGLGVLLVWLAVKDKTPEEIQNIKTAITQANYFWILVSLLISWFSHYLRALRWKLLLEPLHFKPKTANTVFAVFVGYLANLALPRFGEVTRCGVLARYEKIPFVQGFGSVIAERALDVVCVILLFFITLALEFDKISGIANDLILNIVSEKLTALFQKPKQVIIIVVLMIACILVLVYFRKKIQSKMSGKVRGFVKGLLDGILSVKNVNKPVLFISHTILIWLCYVLQVYVCFFAFQELGHLSFVVAMVVTVFGSLAIAVVPGGTGVYQLIVIQILTTVYFISNPTSFAFAWAVWASQVSLILIGGLTSLILLPLVNKNK